MTLISSNDESSMGTSNIQIKTTRLSTLGKGAQTIHIARHLNFQLSKNSFLNQKYFKNWKQKIQRINVAGKGGPLHSNSVLDGSFHLIICCADYL